MTQLQLPLTDATETRRERLMRLLSGELGHHVQTAKTFTEANAREAERLANVPCGRTD